MVKKSYSMSVESSVQYLVKGSHSNHNGKAYISLRFPISIYAFLRNEYHENNKKYFIKFLSDLYGL